MIEALQRLIHPPEMSTDRLLLVSFVGLVVNLVGIFAFNHGHAHGGHDHGHGHGHHGHDHGHSANMQGVFLHIMADTLGSAGVIVSTLLIQWFGWTGFDPIASLFIAVLIVMSVIPLIRQSASVLMLELSDPVVNQVEGTVEEIKKLEGVTEVSNYRFWPNEAETVVGSLHVLVNENANHQEIRRNVSEIFSKQVDGLKEICVQVESANSARLQKYQQEKQPFGYGNQYTFAPPTQMDHHHHGNEDHHHQPMNYYSPTPANATLHHHHHPTPPPPPPTSTNFRSTVIPQPTFATDMPISVKKKD